MSSGEYFYAVFTPSRDHWWCRFLHPDYQHCYLIKAEAGQWIVYGKTTDGLDLFTLPDSWLPYFVFSKLVASLAFGGTPGKITYVAMRAVPMGWTNSVALLHNFLRNLLYKTIKVPRKIDVNPKQKTSMANMVIMFPSGRRRGQSQHQIGNNLFSQMLHFSMPG